MFFYFFQNWNKNWNKNNTFFEGVVQMNITYKNYFLFIELGPPFAYYFFADQFIELPKHFVLVIGPYF